MFYYRGDFILEGEKNNILEGVVVIYGVVFTFVVAMAFAFDHLGDVVAISYKCIHCS